MDISSATRKGRIQGPVRRTKLKSESGALSKVIFFDIVSRIDVGDGEVVEDVAKVLLLDEAVDQFNSLPFKPKEGDTVRVYNCLCYVRSGSLCFRCALSGQMEVDQAKGAVASSEPVSIKTVEAEQYFRSLVIAKD